MSSAYTVLIGFSRKPWSDINTMSDNDDGDSFCRSRTRDYPSGPLSPLPYHSVSLVTQTPSLRHCTVVWASFYSTSAKASMKVMNGIRGAFQLLCPWRSKFRVHYTLFQFSLNFERDASTEFCAECSPLRMPADVRQASYQRRSMGFANPYYMLWRTSENQRLWDCQFY